MTSRHHVGGVNKREWAILEEYINPLGIKLLFNAKTIFCFNGCWSHERTHFIEGNRLTEGQIIDTMDIVKCYPAQPSPFPTNYFTPRSEQHYFKFSL